MTLWLRMMESERGCEMGHEWKRRDGESSCLRRLGGPGLKDRSVFVVGYSYSQPLEHLSSHLRPVKKVVGAKLGFELLQTPLFLFGLC
jgi:hypothetical protein